MSKSIVIQPLENGFSITIPGEAIRAKSEALAKAALVTIVSSLEEQEKAIAAVAELKGLSSGMETVRVEVKKPYWDTGKAIDAKAKEYVESIDKRASEIERLIADFQRKEREKVEAARREEERKQREAAEAIARQQREAAQAEIRRQQAERSETEARERREQAERAEAAANTPEAKAAAAQELERQKQAEIQAQAEREKAADDAIQLQIDASEACEDAAGMLMTVIHEPVKISGLSVGEKTEFEITDIEAVYAWDRIRRDRIEAIQGRAPLLTILEMTIKKTALKELLKTLSPDEIAMIPGVIFSQNTKVNVRAGTPNFIR